MDDFIALLMAVAAGVAGVMLAKGLALGLGALGALDTATLHQTAQAAIGLAIAVPTYRRAIRGQAGRTAS